MCTDLVQMSATEWNERKQPPVVWRPAAAAKSGADVRAASVAKNLILILSNILTVLKHSETSQKWSWCESGFDSGKLNIYFVKHPDSFETLWNQQSGADVRAASTAKIYHIFCQTSWQFWKTLKPVKNEAETETVSSLLLHYIQFLRRQHILVGLIWTDLLWNLINESQTLCSAE